MGGLMGRREPEAALVAYLCLWKVGLIILIRTLGVILLLMIVHGSRLFIFMTGGVGGLPGAPLVDNQGICRFVYVITCDILCTHSLSRQVLPMILWNVPIYQWNSKPRPNSFDPGSR
jgi:hypothetical protein